MKKYKDTAQCSSVKQLEKLLRDMEEYKLEVTATKESALAFLKRIGAPLGEKQ